MSLFVAKLITPIYSIGNPFKPDLGKRVTKMTVWQARRWFVRPIFDAIWLVYLALTRLLGSRRPNSWIWLGWTFLWPLIMAHLCHWAGPQLLLLVPGPVQWAHNIFLDPLSPVTRTFYADMGWWLGLFFGVFQVAFQNATWTMEESLHPNDDRFLSPVTPLLYPLNRMAEAILTLYRDMGALAFLVWLLFTAGIPVALVDVAIRWASAHGWDVVGHFVLTVVALIVGIFAGTILGFAMVSGFRRLIDDALRPWANLRPSNRGPSPEGGTAVSDAPQQPPSDRIRL